MKAFATAALSALAAATAFALPANASVMDPEIPFLRAEVQRNTPQCRSFPEYDVVGRVSGSTGNPATTVSFTGCFPTYRACEEWRGWVSGKIAGRLIYNACEPRR
jgi:hypothetical protein